MIATTESLADVPCTGAHVWPLRITATADEGEDSKVFVYKRESALYTEDVFWKVASVEELVSIPADAPAPDDLFFRTDVVHYHARYEDEAHQILAAINVAVELLNLDLAAILSAGTAETYSSTGD